MTSEFHKSVTLTNVDSDESVHPPFKLRNFKLCYVSSVTVIAGVCNCSVFCCMLLYVHSSIVIILMGKRELIALLSLSSWCLVMVEWLFLVVSWGCLQFVIVVFPDHTQLLFYYRIFKRLA